MLNSTPRPWLPPCALSGDAAERLLGGIVEGWSREWIGRRPLRLLPRSCNRAGLGEAEDWHSLGDGIAVGRLPGMAAKLAAEMLDTKIETGSLTASDAAAIGRLADGCLDDLRKRLARELEAQDGWRASPPGAALLAEGLSVIVGTADGAALLRLLVGADQLVDLVKRSVRTPPRPVPLRSLAEALAQQRVELAALLGGCELALADLETLASGDVVVLDRMLDDALDLTLDGAARSGRCRLADEGERLALRIETPFFKGEATK